MKWETIVSSDELSIDMGILPSTGEYIARIFLDKEPPAKYSWKPIFGRVAEVSYPSNDVPKFLKLLIDAIPEHQC